MAKMSKKLKLKNVRLSYANLFEPRKNTSGDFKYSTAAMLPHDHPQIEEIEAAIEEVGKNAFGAKWDAMKKKKGIPLKNADEDGTADEKPEYEGMRYFNASSTRQPQVVDRQVQPILSEQELWSGCYANLTVAVYDFEGDENKGVTFGLNNAQKVREGERLGGAPNADEEFDVIEDEEEEGFEID